jgi:DNA-directed RNA polymerase subunit beta
VRRIVDIPNLIDIQKSSYDKFLQMNVPARASAQEVGLQAVFRSVFPIKDFNGTSELVFVSYNLEKPKYDVDECRQRGMTFAAPIKVTIQLMIYDTRDGGERIVRDIKEQEVYFGEIPLMTDTGTFIINGTERVVVSQLHRSPRRLLRPRQGQDALVRQAALLGPRDPLPRLVARLRVRPEGHHLRPHRPPPQDARDGAAARPRLHDAGPAQLLLLDRDGLPREGRQVRQEHRVRSARRPARDARHQGRLDVIVKKNTKFTKAAIKKLKDAKLDRLPSSRRAGRQGRRARRHRPGDGRGLVEVQRGAHRGQARAPREAKIESFKHALHRRPQRRQYLRDTLLADKVKTTEDAIIEIYRRLRPGDPPTLETAKTLFHNLFFNPERYDLSKVGRLKLNYKFYRDLPARAPAARPRRCSPRRTSSRRCAPDRAQERPRLGRRHRPPRQPPRARRRRADGEPVPHRPRPHGARHQGAHEHVARDRHAHAARPDQREARLRGGEGVLRELAALAVHGPDQPAQEVTHKRRLSALGPGGLTRERAGFEVRDVHATHYGRICPIETPEGPNIGLIASLSTYARVNEYGFVETPYRKVEGQA